MRKNKPASHSSEKPILGAQSGNRNYDWVSLALTAADIINYYISVTYQNFFRSVSIGKNQNKS